MLVLNGCADVAGMGYRIWHILTVYASGHTGGPSWISALMVLLPSCKLAAAVSMVVGSWTADAHGRRHARRAGMINLPGTGACCLLYRCMANSNHCLANGDALLPERHSLMFLKTV